MKCGEHTLLPRAREASRDTFIIADGFSCQEQIAQLTERRALHLAQLVQMALKQTDGNKQSSAFRESILTQEREAAVRRSTLKAGTVLRAVVAGAAVACAIQTRK